MWQAGGGSQKRAASANQRGKRAAGHNNSGQSQGRNGPGQNHGRNGPGQNQGRTGRGNGAEQDTRTASRGADSRPWKKPRHEPPAPQRPPQRTTSRGKAARAAPSHNASSSKKRAEPNRGGQRHDRSGSQRGRSSEWDGPGWAHETWEEGSSEEEDEDEDENEWGEGSWEDDEEDEDDDESEEEEEEQGETGAVTNGRRGFSPDRPASDAGKQVVHALMRSGAQEAVRVAPKADVDVCMELFTPNAAVSAGITKAPRERSMGGGGGCGFPFGMFGF